MYGLVSGGRMKSNIDCKRSLQKLGAQEFMEIARPTPSRCLVFLVRQGGILKKMDDPVSFTLQRIRNRSGGIRI